MRVTGVGNTIRWIGGDNPGGSGIPDTFIQNGRLLSEDKAFIRFAGAGMLQDNTPLTPTFEAVNDLDTSGTFDQVQVDANIRMIFDNVRIPAGTVLDMEQFSTVTVRTNLHNDGLIRMVPVNAVDLQFQDDATWTTTGTGQVWMFGTATTRIGQIGNYLNPLEHPAGHVIFIINSGNAQLMRDNSGQFSGGMINFGSIIVRQGSLTLIPELGFSFDNKGLVRIESTGTAIHFGNKAGDVFNNFGTVDNGVPKVFNNNRKFINHCGGIIIGPITNVGSFAEFKQISCTISISDVTLPEGDLGNTQFDFTVDVSITPDPDAQTPMNTISVDFATQDDTATAPSDYLSTSGTLTIAAGSTTGTVSVDVVGDTNVEGDETFLVNLSNLNSNQNIAFADSQGLGTILDDDVPLSCSDPQIPNSDSAGCEGTASGNTCTITCNSGYALSGSSPTCQGGQWDSLPTCNDVDECNDPNACNGNGLCTNTQGGFSCTCAPGFAGANCDACAQDRYDYPTCRFCESTTTCNGNGVCDSQGFCSCAPGYAGVNCTDVDECLQDPTICGPNAVCTNSLGNFTCECEPGFELDPTTGQCVNVEPPTSTPGKVTGGGGQLDKNVNFGFNVQSDGISLKGQLQYNDKADGIKLHSQEMTFLSIDPSRTSATFEGIAKDGSLFVIDVEDNGEPGKNDEFSIKILDPAGSIIYEKSGTLTKGNIQIHK